MLSNVDLPQPEWPMIETNSPFSGEHFGGDDDQPGDAHGQADAGHQVRQDGGEQNAW
jgi:hypothetical protein